jgi:hypothetical protein
MAEKAASLGNAWENARSIAEVYGLAPEQGDDYGDCVFGCFRTGTINLVATLVR